MTTFFIIAILVLGFLITFQIAKASEYVAVMRGWENSRKQTNRINGYMMLIFLIAGLIGVWWCNHELSGKILGLRAEDSASDHGEHINFILKLTFYITGIVFFITQIMLFWFAYKYQESDTRKAYYFPHNNKLELLWTVVPALFLTVLVGLGLYYWFGITGDAPKDAMVVEVTGKQFGWEFRYPGKDGQLGKKYYKNIDDAKQNPLGQIWDDPANRDDVYVGQEMHLVKGKPVKLIIGSKDVIHDVGLAQFRLKMDAVPGTPTTMWFTPKYTTREMKEKSGDPDYVYEISCDQMCGKGHYSMRGVIVVETQAEFDAWLASKKPQYLAAHPDEDPANKAKPATAVDSTAATAQTAEIPAAVAQN